MEERERYYITMHLHKKGTVFNFRHLLVTWHDEGIIIRQYIDEDVVQYTGANITEIKNILDTGMMPNNFKWELCVKLIRPF